MITVKVRFKTTAVGFKVPLQKLQNSILDFQRQQAMETWKSLNIKLV